MLEEMDSKPSGTSDVELGEVYAGQEWPADVKEKYANSFSKVRQKCLIISLQLLTMLLTTMYSLSLMHCIVKLS
jgi:hypothetical protein